MSSRSAENLLEDQFKDSDVVDIFETKTHDGYDCDGPESNLWDLHIITLENQKYVYYHFHWEDWFCSNNTTYKLEYKSSIDDMYSATKPNADILYHLKIVKTMGQEDPAFMDYTRRMKKKNE